jgi:hypothetical protein
MERTRENDIGAQKMNERLSWGVEIIKEVAKNNGIAFNEAIFLKGCEAGISMFIQSERR